MLNVRILAAVFVVLGTIGAARAQVPQATFSDCAQCPEMVALPGGTFTMGVPRGEEEREGVPADLRGRSEPLRRVTIAPGLAMSRTPVTLGQFTAFVEATGHAPESSCWAFVNNGATYEYQETPSLNWRNPGFAQKEDHPVVCVNWQDAEAYARWLATTTGKPYRLPSEAEWEFAARAGTTTARFWGDSQAPACEFANVADLSLAEALNLDRRPQFSFRCNDRHVYTAAVRSFRPNAFGLYDMLGNVWQWTLDCLNPNLEGQPADGSPRLYGDCAARAMRGGSWSHLPWYVRAGNRVRGTAADRFNFAGIRVVRDR
ncbi:formylglycine-generating enzyme family protein [Roseomonas terrae]|jgi:sulfatase modifying factor 1|uniref:Formylglycine-generating enzyme family protein n=1 Tax=Neoroseomonas terrae TaxID=424799 RepID=A0ABS5EED3_9PROT|nr:formylglycine-generating enzyme family protein [Neoroseomonas terrae]MBR0649372.1 formylglycine-generating enzyme family protein [Neoroseomonas terrae]